MNKPMQKKEWNPLKNAENVTKEVENVTIGYLTHKTFKPQNPDTRKKHFLQSGINTGTIQHRAANVLPFSGIFEPSTTNIPNTPGMTNYPLWAILFNESYNYDTNSNIQTIDTHFSWVRIFHFFE